MSQQEIRMNKTLGQHQRVFELLELFLETVIAVAGVDYRQLMLSLRRLPTSRTLGQWFFQVVDSQSSGNERREYDQVFALGTCTFSYLQV